jgi:hypothetical protein
VERDYARPYYEPEPIDERPRPRRSGKKTLLYLVGFFVLGPIVLFGTWWLAVQKTYGKITFSSDAAACTVGGVADKFAAGSTIYGTVILDRGVSVGEELTKIVRNDDVVLTADSFRIVGAGICSSELIDDGHLARGHYHVTYSAGGETLADGTFDVT